MQDKNQPDNLVGVQRRFVKFGGGVSKQQLLWLEEQLQVGLRRTCGLLQRLKPCSSTTFWNNIHFDTKRQNNLFQSSVQQQLDWQVACCHCKADASMSYCQCPHVCCVRRAGHHSLAGNKAACTTAAGSQQHHYQGNMVRP